MIALLALVPEAKGILRWERTYGGRTNEVGYDVKQTPDGGYVAAGHDSTNSMWLVRIDSLGDSVWTRRFKPQGANWSWALAVVCTHDGGYAIAGGCNLGLYPDTIYMYLVRTDSAGHELWSKRYGGQTTHANDLEETDDGGFILAGYRESLSSGQAHTYVVRTDSLGNQLWARSYGNQQRFQWANAVKCTPDGGFIVCGVFNFTDVPKAWLIRIDSLGNLRWERQYGSSIGEEFKDVCILSDGGFAATGYTVAHGGIDEDVYLVRTDSLGNTRWVRSYGGLDGEAGYGICLTADGGFALVGGGYSYGAGNSDGYLLKTDSIGNLQWTKTFGGWDSDYLYSIQECGDRGFVMAGRNASFGAGWHDLYVVKTDHAGCSAVREADSFTVSSQSARITVTPSVLAQANPTVRLAYYVPSPTRVRIYVYDASGRSAVKIPERRDEPGWNGATVPASTLSSGVYLVRIETSGFPVVGRFTIVGR